MGARGGGARVSPATPGRSSEEIADVSRMAITLLTAALANAPVAAEQTTLTVAGYGGSFEQTLRKSVFPPFETKHGVRIDYVAGNSTDTLAKLQAQKGNQVIDVAIVDDGPMYQAIELGLCAPIDWYIGPSSTIATSITWLPFCACSLASVSVELPAT